MTGQLLDTLQPVERDDLFSPIASIGQGVLVAAGPWLFTVAAVGAISHVAERYVPLEAIEGFRLLVIYGFALSLIVTAPIAIVATRLIGDAVYVRAYGRIRSLFPAAVVLSGCASAGLALVIYGAVFRLPAGLVVAGSSLAGVIGMIWIGLAFASSFRDYRGTTAWFLVGLMAAVAAVGYAAASSGQVVAMVLAFNAGLSITLCGLVSRVLRTYPQPVVDLMLPIRVLLLGMSRYRRLAMGGGMAALAIWVDKWVIWAGPEKVIHSSGLVHAPLYDSAMFTAYLAIIPALSFFVAQVETVFQPTYRLFQLDIEGHATLGQIEQRASDVERTTMGILARILLVHAPICLIVAMAAPSLVVLASLTYQQIGILRLGALGAVFQFIFFACTSLLLYLDQDGLFLRCQAFFLVLQAVLAGAAVALGTTYYGFGNLVACVLAGMLAFAALDRSIKNLVFLTFVPAGSPATGSFNQVLRELDLQSKASLPKGLVT